MIQPASVPQLPEPEIRSLIAKAFASVPALPAASILSACPAQVLAIRGYYRDTMGEPARNDVGMYDDAAFLVTPDKIERFNWNTDPSKVGWNPGVGKPFAMLCPGIWPFIRGLHKGQGPAWRQPDENDARRVKLSTWFPDYRGQGHFKVFRAPGLPTPASPTDTGYHAINIHWGGQYGTSSWGCQTAPASMWPAFQLASYKAASAQPFLPYILIDNPS